jgi:hypothetical protein
MYQVFKPVCTDEAKTKDSLAFILQDEHTRGYHSHPRLEHLHIDGYFVAGQVLPRFFL